MKKSFEKQSGTVEIRSDFFYRIFSGRKVNLGYTKSVFANENAYFELLSK
jgi:hypothetical protein